MKQGIARQWFQSFIQTIGLACLQVLILDSHDSHNYVELVDDAGAENIHLLHIRATGYSRVIEHCLAHLREDITVYVWS